MADNKKTEPLTDEDLDAAQGGAVRMPEPDPIYTTLFPARRIGTGSVTEGVEIMDNEPHGTIGPVNAQAFYAALPKDVEEALKNSK